MSNRMINIGGDANDASYRYKMSALQTKIEGRGNGIKTVLMNISDVAKQLHTEPPYATKFFGMEVGALSQYDHKRNVGIVHGVHQTKELQKMLKKFVNDFILCPKCKLPELQFKVHQKKAVLLQKCASCGWKGSNSSNHKVKTYIINHPPVKSKKSKNMRSRKHKAQKKVDDNNNEDGKIDDFKSLGWDNDEVWSVDASDEAVAKRKQKEMDRMALKNKNKTNKRNNTKITKNDNNNNKKKNNDNSPSQILRNYVENGDKTYLEILDEIKRISLARKFDQKKKIQLTIEALCKLNDLDSFIESLKKYKVILAQFTKNTNDCKIFFGVLEEFVCRRNPDAFLSPIYKILECLYDEDIVNEEDMIKWADSPSDEAVIVDKEEAESIRSKAQPFIKWLKENDDDESDTDDDE